MEAEVRGVNFRRLEPEALRRPIDEMNGDCGRNSLVHGKVIFLHVRLHKFALFRCVAAAPSGRLCGCHELRFGKAARDAG